MNPVIIYDLEFTAWEGSWQRHWSLDWEHREVVQIGAVKGEWYNGVLTAVDQYQSYVKPVNNPELSDYFVQLTGIDQNSIDAFGMQFEQAMSSFYAFCGFGNYPMYSWGEDWSVITENYLLRGLPQPAFYSGFFDIRYLFLQYGIKVEQYTSGNLCSHFGISVNGRAHNALHDSFSVFESLRVLVSQMGDAQKEKLSEGWKQS